MKSKLLIYKVFILFIVFGLLSNSGFTQTLKDTTQTEIRVDSTENESEIKKKISKEIPKIIKKPTNKGSKFFSYLIVFIISFVALVVLVDTLKTPLISIFPGLEIILFNLFETLQDLKLFIIDLT